MSPLLFAFCIALQFGQSSTGELHVTVIDAGGLPIQSSVELVSEANQVRQQLSTTDAGTLVAKRLPFGRYRVAVSRDGFTPFAGLVEIQSALPTEFKVTLTLATLSTQVTVTSGDTLLDPHRTSTLNHIGADALA